MGAITADELEAEQAVVPADRRAPGWAGRGECRSSAPGARADRRHGDPSSDRLLSARPVGKQPEVAEHSVLDPGDRFGRRPRPTVSIGTSESAASSEPWLPPPRWCRPARSTNSQPGAAETSTSPAFGLRERRGGTLAPVGHRVEDRVVLVAVRRATTRPPSRKRTIPAAGCSSRCSATRADRRVDHCGAVRRGNEVVAGVEARDAVDLDWPWSEHTTTAYRSRNASGPPAASMSAPIAASERASASCALSGPGVRGEVVVREVVDEQVEPVASHEPPADHAAYASIDPSARLRTAIGAPVRSLS